MVGRELGKEKESNRKIQIGKNYTEMKKKKVKIYWNIKVTLRQIKTEKKEKEKISKWW